MGSKGECLPDGHDLLLSFPRISQDEKIDPPVDAFFVAAACSTVVVDCWSSRLEWLGGGFPVGSCQGVSSQAWLSTRTLQRKSKTSQNPSHSLRIAALRRSFSPYPTTNS